MTCRADISTVGRRRVEAQTVFHEVAMRWLLNVIVTVIIAM